MEKVGIQKIKAVLSVIEKLGVAEQKVMADNKIDMADLPVAIGLLSGMSDDIKAMKEISGVVGEAKDLDQSEVMEIIAEVYRVVKAIEDAA